MKRIFSGILAGLIACFLLVPAGAASKNTVDPNVRTFSGAQITVPNLSESVTDYTTYIKSTQKTIGFSQTTSCPTCRTQRLFVHKSMVDCVNSGVLNVYMSGTADEDRYGNKVYPTAISYTTSVISNKSSTVYSIGPTYLAQGTPVLLSTTPKTVTYCSTPGIAVTAVRWQETGDGRENVSRSFTVKDIRCAAPSGMCPITYVCSACGYALPGWDNCYEPYATGYANICNQEYRGNHQLSLGFLASTIQYGTNPYNFRAGVQQTANLIDYSLSPIAGETAKPIELKNCTSSVTLNSAFNGSVPVEINGGNYSGSPALQSQWL